MDWLAAARSPDAALAQTLRETIEEFESVTEQHRQGVMGLAIEHKEEMMMLRKRMTEQHLAETLALEQQRDELLAELAIHRSAATAQQPPKRTPGGSTLWEQGAMLGCNQPLAMETQLKLEMVDQLRAECDQLKKRVQSQLVNIDIKDAKLQTSRFEFDELRAVHEELSARFQQELLRQESQLQAAARENNVLRGDAEYQAEASQASAQRVKMRASRRIMYRASSDCVTEWRQRTRQAVAQQQAQRTLKRAAKRMMNRDLSDCLMEWLSNAQNATVQQRLQMEKQALQGAHEHQIATVRRSSINDLNTSQTELQKTKALAAEQRSEHKAMLQQLDDALLKWQLSTMDTAGAGSLFDSIDQNSDGVIDNSEFERWRARGPQPDRPTAINAWSLWSQKAAQQCRQWDVAMSYAATLCSPRRSAITLVEVLQQQQQQLEAHKMELLSAISAADKQRATQEALEHGRHVYALQRMELESARKSVEYMKEQLRSSTVRRASRILSLWSGRLPPSTVVQRWRRSVLDQRTLLKDGTASGADNTNLEPYAQSAPLGTAPHSEAEIETSAREIAEGELHKARELLKIAQVQVEQQVASTRQALTELQASEQAREALEQQLAHPLYSSPSASPKRQLQLGIAASSPSPSTSPSQTLKVLAHVGVHQHIACTAVSEPTYATFQNKLRNAQDPNTHS